MKLCDLDAARALQELGYDGEYTHFYHPDGQCESLIDNILMERNIPKRHIPALRLDDAAYWLREKHGIHIAIIPSYESESDDAYSYQIWRYYSDDDWSCVTYCVDYPHDDALGEAVKQAIEIIKNKKQ